MVGKDSFNIWKAVCQALTVAGRHMYNICVQSMWNTIIFQKSACQHPWVPGILDSQDSPFIDMCLYEQPVSWFFSFTLLSKPNVVRHLKSHPHRSISSCSSFYLVSIQFYSINFNLQKLGHHIKIAKLQMQTWMGERGGGNLGGWVDSLNLDLTWGIEDL